MGGLGNKVSSISEQIGLKHQTFLKIWITLYLMRDTIKMTIILLGRNRHNLSLMSKIVSSQKRKISDFKSNYARNQMEGLSQVLENTIAKCNAYNPKDKKSAPFRDTLLPILKDQLDVFGDVLESNLLSDCPKLSKSIEQAQKIINGVTVQDLRDDDSKRKDVADKLSEVHDDITDNEIDNFNELMG